MREMEGRKGRDGLRGGRQVKQKKTIFLIDHTGWWCGIQGCGGVGTQAGGCGGGKGYRVLVHGHTE